MGRWHCRVRRVLWCMENTWYGMHKKKLRFRTQKKVSWKIATNFILVRDWLTSGVDAGDTWILEIYIKFPSTVLRGIRWSHCRLGKFVNKKNHYVYKILSWYCHFAIKNKPGTYLTMLKMVTHVGPEPAPVSVLYQSKVCH